MIDPIAILMEEHRLFLWLLDALERWAARLEQGDDVASDLPRFVRVLVELVDQHHHGKEEDILFRAMIAHGFPSDQGPLAVMLHEHELGRAHVLSLRSLAEAPPLAHAVAIDHARKYAALLRQHIHKEDNILYPMAIRLLGPAMSNVAEHCDRYEQADTVRAQVASLMGEVDTLLERYAPR